jgi:LPS-assembly lipoprotein
MKKLLLFIVTSIALSACGFQLRGAYNYPFASAVLQTPAASPDFGLAMRRSMETNASVKLLDETSAQALVAQGPAKADFVRIRVLEVFNDKKILSLSSGGKVREFQLEQRVKFDVVDAFERQILAPRTLNATREYSFSDAQALAKEGEERMLRVDMQADIIGQVLRQLQSARKPN